MTDNEINIIIAKKCGWTHFDSDTVQYVARRSDGKWDCIPNYCGDLNGMHQAIVSVIHKDPHVRRRYLQTLDEITGDQWNTVDATARQRAEAFVKVIGKWVDSPEKEL